jgi:short-subunit dehydrogenase
MTGETWLVLGGSSPVARAFAGEAARRGDEIILAGRDVADLERTAADVAIRCGSRAEVQSFDATAYAEHAAFVARCCRPGKRINVFLAFAAMPPQPEIERDPSRGIGAIEATFTGAVSVLLHLAPVMEKQGGGRIVVLGSVAGDRGRRKNYVYGSAKAGLHAFLQGLRSRLFRSGVTVTTVKPGFMDTAMTWGAPGLFLMASPARCAAACLDAASRGREEIYVPGPWRMIMFLLQHLPERLFKRLTI